MHVGWVPPNAASALIAIAEKVIDALARLRCWPNDRVCDAACYAAAAGLNCYDAYQW